MRKVYIILLALVVLSSCKAIPKKSNTSETKEDSKEVSVESNWIYLFDGSSTEGWRAYNGDLLPEQWVIKDGALTFDTESKVEAEKSGVRQCF